MYKTTGKKHNHHFDLAQDIAKIRAALATTAKDVGGKASEIFSQTMENVRDTSTDLKERCDNYVATQPYKALAFAVLSGAAFAVMMRKRKLVRIRHRE
jgi:ElaB/YqjD/DUF883 family membrane-anchored ribosome-binding protein